MRRWDILGRDGRGAFLDTRLLIRGSTAALLKVHVFSFYHCGGTEGGFKDVIDGEFVAYRLSSCHYPKSAAVAWAQIS